MISEGLDTTVNKFLRGILPRGTTFEFEFETKYENNLD
jgi:hypothetical protein